MNLNRSLTDHWLLLVVAVISFAALASLPGCTTISNGMDRGLDLRGMRTPAGPIVARDIMPRQRSMREYTIVSGPAAGRVILQSVEPTTDHGAEWVFNNNGTRLEFWGRDEDDNVVLPLIIDYEDRTISMFDPPLILIPAELQPGEQHRDVVDMLVFDSQNPDRLLREGIAMRTVEYIHDQMIQTPSGEYRTHRLAVRFRAELPQAEIERTSTVFLVPGIGLVAEESAESVRVMNLIDRQRERSIALSRIQEAGE